MKSFIMGIALLCSSFIVSAQSYMLLPIVEVYDGDTIKTTLSWRLPEPLNEVSIRIYGIDTPELPAASYAETGKLSRADCVQEAELALKAKAAVKELAADYSKMKVYDFDWDKYGGRILASVKIGGINVAKYLIEQGLAVEYYGSGPKKNWCE